MLQATSFNRLGKLGLLVKTTRSFQTLLQSNMTDTTAGVVAQFNAESDIQALMGSTYIGILGSLESACGTAQGIAAATVSRMVFRDNPLLNTTLTSIDVTASIAEVIRQMRLAGATVLRMSVGGTPGPFAGVGNGGVIVSLNRPFDGLPLENAFAENVRVTCSADSYTGGAAAGNETFTVTGTGNESDVFAFDWPLGSNATGQVTAVNGAVSNGGGNVLTNSGFDAFTNNVPDNWALELGVAGTNIAQETSLVYSGAAALRILGDGATLTRITQGFGSGTGTSTSLSPQTQYAFAVFLRRDGIAPAAGVLQIDLADGGGTVINDYQGVPNSFQVDLTGLSTVYTAYTGVFRTPEILPASASLRIWLSTPLTAGRSVYLDLGSLGIMTQLYTSGPFFSVYSGNTPFVASPVPDFAVVAITNSRGAGGTLSTFQTLWAQLFPDMINQEFLLPSSAAPTISDSLIG